MDMVQQALKKVAWISPITPFQRASRFELPMDLRTLEGESSMFCAISHDHGRQMDLHALLIGMTSIDYLNKHCVVR